MAKALSAGYDASRARSPALLPLPSSTLSDLEQKHDSQLHNPAALASLRFTLKNIIRCLVKIKDSLPEGTSLRVYELEEVVISLSAECDDLDRHQSSAQACAPSSTEAKDALVIRDHVDAMATRCSSEVAGRLYRDLYRELNPEPSRDLSLPPTRINLQRFLNLLADYEDAKRLLRYFERVFGLLQTSLLLTKQRIDLQVAKEAHLEEKTEKSKEDLRKAEYSAHRTAQLLKSQLSFVTNDADTLAALDISNNIYRSWRSTSRNHHFPDRAPANNFYIGRARELDIIKEAFEEAESPAPVQKRFIIQGQPGTGKTELALRYAIENKNKFWGVFWVDASSKENATRSYADMAKTFGENSTEHAAKQFLANRHAMHPWLLILDNADDDDISIDGLCPPGRNGYVLVTTRNPGKTSDGTVGGGFVELNVMQENDASDLLLTAAKYVEKSRTPSVLEKAGHICRKLHHLPLAIVHAGQAIFVHNLKLADYMDYFSNEARRIRIELKRKLGVGAKSESLHTNNLSVFASFELLTIRHLEVASRDEEEFSDALQLLQIFSFMHFRNIRVDFLMKAAMNPMLEKDAQKKALADEDAVLRRLGISKPSTIGDNLRQAVQTLVEQMSFGPVLPNLMRGRERLHQDDFKDQLRTRVHVALRLLLARGLISRSKDIKSKVSGVDDDDQHQADAYNMHPLVHEWVRGRPRLSDAEKVLNCQFAVSILSNAVRLTDNAADELEMRMDLKPHIDHARRCLAMQQEQIEKNIVQMSSAWPMRAVRFVFKLVSGPWQSRMEINEYARFGRVYLECGEYKKAEELFCKVHDYLLERLGPDHKLVHDVKQAVALILSVQSRNKEASELHAEIQQSCYRVLGRKHPRTLDATIKLAESVIFLGRMTDALNLCEEAQAGFIAAYGDLHPKNIRCIRLIGKVQFYWWHFAKSTASYREAIQLANELQQRQGKGTVPEEDLLAWEEELAGALFYDAKGGQVYGSRVVHPERLDEAERLLSHALQRRAALTGRKHPLTLWTAAQYARCKALQGFSDGDSKILDEGQNLLKSTVTDAINDESIRDGHLGVMMGKRWYGEILMMRGQLTEAEEYLRAATDKEHFGKMVQGIIGDHVDRVLNMMVLVNCLQEQGRIEEALTLGREIESSIPHIGGHGLGSTHKFNGYLTERIEELEALLSISPLA